MRPRHASEAARRRAVLINTTAGVLMASLDGSVLTVSLPTIAHDLRVGAVLMLWVVMAYTVATTALLLPLGRLSDLVGRVRPYTFGFAIFTVGSLMSGLAFSGTSLLVGRVVQGVGAALLWSNSTALITDAFPPDRRGAALGLNQAAAIGGSLLGLLLGGLITSTLGWRWIFFINLPVGAFGTLWAVRVLREPPRGAVGADLDLPGAAAVTLGLLALLGSLTEVIAGHPKLFPPMAGAGVALLLAFTLWEARTPNPLIDLSLFRLRLFLFGNLSLFLNALARGALMFLLTFDFQGVRGESPLGAGLMLLPLTGTILLVGPAAGRLSDRIGSRGLASAGLLMTAASLYLLARLPLRGPYLPMAAVLAAAGLGNALFNSPNTSAVMGAVPASRRGVAASTRTTMLNAGSLMSIAVSFAIVARAVGAGRLAAFLAGAAAGAGGSQALAFGRGMQEAFLISAAISLVASGLSYLRGGRPAGG